MAMETNAAQSPSVCLASGLGEVRWALRALVNWPSVFCCGILVGDLGRAGILEACQTPQRAHI